MKILVVDDEDLLVKGIRFNLQNEGYEVITGSDGLEAVELSREQNPDLIILDVMMPQMDGMTACARIREFSNVPIILLTAKTGDMDKLMGFEHGADDYVTKPFNILELKARVRALLRRAGTQTAETASLNHASAETSPKLLLLPVKFKARDIIAASSALVILFSGIKFPLPSPFIIPI